MLAKDFISSGIVGGGELEEKDALLLTSHFNLGIGSAGRASLDNVEQQYVSWIAKLLGSILKPDLVVMLGYVGFSRNPQFSEMWRKAGGMDIEWTRPDAKFPFSVPSKKRVHFFREWHIQRGDRDTRLVIWPNHPSRSPFSNRALWKKSVQEYVGHYRGT